MVVVVALLLRLMLLLLVLLMPRNIGLADLEVAQHEVHLMCPSCVLRVPQSVCLSMPALSAELLCSVRQNSIHMQQEVRHTGREQCACARMLLYLFLCALMCVSEFIRVRLHKRGRACQAAHTRQTSGRKWGNRKP